MELGFHEELIKILNNEYNVDFNKAELIYYEEKKARIVILIKCESKYFVLGLLDEERCINVIYEAFLDENTKIENTEDFNTIRLSENNIAITKEYEFYVIYKYSNDFRVYDKILKVVEDMSIFKIGMLELLLALEGKKGEYLNGCRIS